MRYLRITGPDMNNGEGCRITLWLPGCTHKCKGCHNEWTHNYNQGADFTEDTYIELLEKLTPSYISGLTISGGDPLYQSNNVLADLYEWITRIRTDMPDKTIWLYTGFNFEDLRGIQMEIAQMCDVIVDGPYIEELRDVSLPFRGSSNQRIIRIQQQMTKKEAKSKYIISEQNKNDMKKSIFKGIINGQEFDNVNDYNMKMTELVGAGVAIDATSSTQIKEVCDGCGEEECKCDSATATESEPEAVIDMLPVFSRKNYKTVGEYLDSVVSESGEKNICTIDNLHTYLKENHGEVLAKMANMDEHSLENYRCNLVEVAELLKESIQDNNKAIRKVRAKFNVLNAGADILDAIMGEYNSLIENVDARLLSYSNECDKSEMDKDNKMPTPDEIQKAFKSFCELFGLN